MTTPTLPSKDTSYAALNESLIGEIKIQVYNSLKQYTYEFYKKELGGSQYITGEAKEKVVDDIATYLVQLKGDSVVYNPLIQNIRTAHSKEVEFRNKAFKVFKRELIFPIFVQCTPEHANARHSTPVHARERQCTPENASALQCTPKNASKR